MRSVAQLEVFMEAPTKQGVSPEELAQNYLQVGEDMLIHWLLAKELVPSTGKKEGFRILALHRQGCKGDPSFNACRETCRELAYFYTLITMEPNSDDMVTRLSMMKMVAKHLVLFIGSKMQVAEVGEFCCSAKVNRLDCDELKTRIGVK
ncbi:MAG: hypothetical protein V3U57_06290 [Robiginitomaculum sp.]